MKEIIKAKEDDKEKEKEKENLMLAQAKILFVSQEEIVKTYFDGLEIESSFGLPDCKDCFINNRRWKYINLGAGNHLYLREDFWYEHGNRIMDVSDVKRYVNWKKLIRER